MVACRSGYVITSPEPLWKDKAPQSMTGKLQATHSFDAAVIGAGPAGIATGLALAHIGAKVVLAGPPPKVGSAHPETRTAALLTSSVDFLKRLNVWESLAPFAAPLRAIRIVDASRSPLRSQDIVFKAQELGLDAFGYNIANTVLSAALYARAQTVLARLTPETVRAITIDDIARVTLSDGSDLRVRLIAGADGRNSVCRMAAGIEAKATPYDQAAIASSFHHALAHDGVSTEVHREGGSVTSVPTPDPLVSSLIWVGGTAEIKALMTCSERDFAAELQQRLGDQLGPVSDPRAACVLSRCRPNRQAACCESDRAGRRSRAYSAADWRTRPQSRLERRRRPRRLRGSCAPPQHRLRGTGCP